MNDSAKSCYNTVICIILDKLSTYLSNHLQKIIVTPLDKAMWHQRGVLYAINIAQKLNCLQVPCSMCSLDGEKTLTSN